MLEVLTAIREIILTVVGVAGFVVIIRKEVRETREHRQKIEKDRNPDPEE